MSTARSVPVDIDGFRASMRQAGVEEVVDMTLEVYVEEAARLFADLEEAVAENDTEAARAAAHSLKSSSGNIWAMGVAELFARMELAASQQDQAAVDSTFAELRPEFEQVMSFLAQTGVGQ